MAVSRHVRTWHRRLSIVVGLQLLLWTTSGLIFSWDPIAVVRGETVLAEPDPAPPVDVGGLMPLSQALAAAGPGAEVDGARLVWRRGRWTWALPTQLDEPAILVDAMSGVPLEELSSVEASVSASAAFTPPASIVDVVRIDDPAGEYKGKPVPAWRVTFDDALNTNVYIDARDGTVTTVRTDIWRRFDFFWMLHIMDYNERADFNTPWLKIFAALGVTTSLSGVWLAVIVLLGRRRKAGRLPAA